MNVHHTRRALVLVTALGLAVAGTTGSQAAPAVAQGWTATSFTAPQSLSVYSQSLKTNVGLPQLATRADGTAVLATADDHTWSSHDGGTTWGPLVDAAPFWCPYGGVPSVTLTAHRVLYGKACEAVGTQVIPSDDGGATFGTGTVAGANPDGGFLSTGPDGTVYLVTQNGEDAGTLLLQRSTDEGRSFDAPVVINRGAGHTSTTDLTSDGPLNLGLFSPVAVDPLHPKELWLTWARNQAQDVVAADGGLNSTDERSTQLFVGHSVDGGTTWTTQRLVDAGPSQPLTDPAGATTQDTNDIVVRSAPALDGHGGIALAYWRRGPGDTTTHVEVVRSKDDGRTWSTPQVVGARDGSALFPFVISDTHGRLDMVWYTSADKDYVDVSSWSFVHGWTTPDGRWHQETVAKDVYTGAGSRRCAAVARTSTGRLLISWVSGNDPDERLWVARKG